MRQTDYVILGLLAERPLSGYQIKKIVDIRFQFFWSESFGQIFPALKSLASQGYCEELPQEGACARVAKRYRITPAGRQALVDWLGQPVEKESLRLEILLKTYFSGYAAPEAMLMHLGAFSESHEKQLHLLNLFQAELERIPDEDGNHRDILRVIDFGQKANRAYLDWCRETKTYFEQKQSIGRRGSDRTQDTAPKGKANQE
ncbi:MAG: PadR family transcriptional regulator [Christensenella sp.]|nr:PadR family transcriptional regulator [Christensenella sp.]